MLLTCQISVSPRVNPGPRWSREPFHESFRWRCSNFWVEICVARGDTRCSCFFLSHVTLNSGKKKEPKPKLFGPVRVGWGSSTWTGGGQKVRYVPRNQGNQTFWAGYPGILPGYPGIAREVSVSAGSKPTRIFTPAASRSSAGVSSTRGCEFV